MDERLRFVRDALSDRFTMSELCARYGVSRRVGYRCRSPTSTRAPAHLPRPALDRHRETPRVRLNVPCLAGREIDEELDPHI